MNCCTFEMLISKVLAFENKNKSIFILFFAHLFVPLQRFSPDGGIGRRAGLKHQWGNPCRFDPGSGYELTSEKCCNFQGYSTYFFPNS